MLRWLHGVDEVVWGWGVGRGCKPSQPQNPPWGFPDAVLAKCGDIMNDAPWYIYDSSLQSHSNCVRMLLSNQWKEYFYTRVYLWVWTTTSSSNLDALNFPYQANWIDQLAWFSVSVVEAIFRRDDRVIKTCMVQPYERYFLIAVPQEAANS